MQTEHDAERIARKEAAVVASAYHSTQSSHLSRAAASWPLQLLCAEAQEPGRSHRLGMHGSIRPSRFAGGPAGHDMSMQWPIRNAQVRGCRRTTAGRQPSMACRRDGTFEPFASDTPRLNPSPAPGNGLPGEGRRSIAGLFQPRLLRHRVQQRGRLLRFPEILSSIGEGCHAKSPSLRSCASENLI